VKRFRLGLIGLILVVGVFLTGCCGVCTPEIQTCSLTVTAGYWVWGEVYINGQPTGQYIDYSIEAVATVVLSVPCNETVYITIVDICGYPSHTEIVSPGQNYLDFYYW